MSELSFSDQLLSWWSNNLKRISPSKTVHVFIDTWIITSVTTLKVCQITETFEGNSISPWPWGLHGVFYLHNKSNETHCWQRTRVCVLVWNMFMVSQFLDLFLSNSPLINQKWKKTTTLKFVSVQTSAAVAMATNNFHKVLALLVVCLESQSNNIHVWLDSSALKYCTSFI